jgi:hypothetical protein
MAVATELRPRLKRRQNNLLENVISSMHVTGNCGCKARHP